MEKKEYSKNDRAEKIVGKRMANGIIIDFPCELDYHCPVCKYEQVKDGNYDERLDWSEYEGFIYCHKCNKDYPSCLCMPDKEKATKIYLDCIEVLLSESKKECLEECIKLSDEIEQGKDTTTEEWRAFKQFRNTLRDMEA
jgi:hypothetical protein